MKCALMTILAVFLTGHLVVAQTNFSSQWGVISAGAFVIPSEGLDWTDPEGRATGKRIGYMRVGTVVKIGACRHVNGASGSGGTYCDVQSETGIAGKTHANRIFPLERGKTYAVARKEIILYDRNDKDRRRDSFSRNLGTIIEVVGDIETTPSDGNVDVIASYNLGIPDALTDLSIKKKHLTEGTYVISYAASGNGPPTKLAGQFDATGKEVLGGGPVALWAFKPVAEGTMETLVNKVVSDLGWKSNPAEDAKELISTAFELVSGVLDRVYCVAQINVDVSAGFKFFGNGLELEGSIPIYEKGKLFDIDIDVLEKDGRAKYWVVTAKTVVCQMGASLLDSMPQAVEAVSFMIMQNLPHTGNAARLTRGMPPRFGLTVPLAVDAENNPRLFEVSGFTNYMGARNLIMYSIAQSSMLELLDQSEREALAHALISKLGSFIRVSPDTVDRPNAQ